MFSKIKLPEIDPAKDILLQIARIVQGIIDRTVLWVDNIRGTNGRRWKSESSVGNVKPPATAGGTDSLDGAIIRT
jgi:hypothetical protein